MVDKTLTLNIAVPRGLLVGFNGLTSGDVEAMSEAFTPEAKLEVFNRLRAEHKLVVIRLNEQPNGESGENRRE